MQGKKREDVFQPNLGWARLCEGCEHRQTDLQRNSFPCNEVEFRGSAKNIADPKWYDSDGNSIDMIGPHLVRYIDDVEECSSFTPTASSLPCTV